MRAWPVWLFWVALYGLCVAVALKATPGAPEAFGFALPAFLAAVLAAWLARRLARPTRLAIALAAAAVLMAGAISGSAGLNRAQSTPSQTAWDGPGASSVT